MRVHRRRKTAWVAVTLAVIGGACSIGSSELEVGQCVDIVGLDVDQASDRLVTVDCDTDDSSGIFRVVSIEQAPDGDLETLTETALACAGPTLLPDADMLAAGDLTVVCFEPVE
ncbi:MAG: hypothetical protein GY720_03325 [bacterium]|nr:hypothetical protein [bacterium]